MSKERMKYKTKYLLENKEKLAKITRNMRIFSLLCLILPLAGYIAIATFAHRPPSFTFTWEPLVAVTGLSGASIFHLMWMVVANKGVEIEFKKDPVFAYSKWLRLPVLGGTSIIWGIVAYLFYGFVWGIIIIFLTIYIFLFIILFKYNAGYYDWVEKILRIAEKRDKRLQRQEDRRKRKR